MGVSKRMKAEGHRGPSPLKGLEAPECSGPHPYPATLSPIGWDCQEGGRGPYRGPLSALEREVELQIKTTWEPLPGQLSWLDTLPQLPPPAPEPPDVVFGVIRKSRRRHAGPAVGQQVFLDSRPKSVLLEGQETPRRSRKKKESS